MPMLLDQDYVGLKNQVIKAERRVLKELGFCVHVKHPHKVGEPQRAAGWGPSSFPFQPHPIPSHSSVVQPILALSCPSPALSHYIPASSIPSQPYPIPSKSHPNSSHPCPMTSHPIPALSHRIPALFQPRPIQSQLRPIPSQGPSEQTPGGMWLAARWQ